MRVKDSDISLLMQPMKRAKIVREINRALDAYERIDKQLQHWISMPVHNAQTKIMLDELLFLRDGKV